MEKTKNEMKKIKFDLLNENQKESKNFIFCGPNDVCSNWDGICTPQFH